MTGNIEAAVDLCLQSNRTADAIIIATTGGSDLLARTQYRYLKKSQSYLSNIISALVTEDWSSVISQCTIDSWKEALVATLTHCRESVPVLCERLGERLQQDGGGNSNTNNVSVIQSAILCYICAGNVERLAETWLITHTESTTASNNELQDLIEVVILFQKALELQGRNATATGKLAELLTQYGNLLAAQGALSSALTYLGPSDDAQIVELRERIYFSLGHKQAYPTRSASQAQNIYAKSQTPNIFMQPRASLTGLGFNAPQQQPPPVATLNTSFNAPNVTSPPKLWNNTATSNFQSQPYAPASFASNPPMPPNVPAQAVTGNDHLPYPPRPSSVSSQTGAAPISRSKYILDPSVQSSGGYGHQPAANSFASNTTFNSQPYANTASTYGQFNTAPFSNSANNSFNSQPNQMSSTFNSAPIGQSSILNPPALNSFVSGVPPIELGQPAIAQQSAQRNPTPPPGWNDPPALKSARPVSDFFFYYSF